MRSALAPVTRLADLAGRRTVILGFARSGAAAARMLADAGAEVAAYDRRRPEELAEFTGALGSRAVRLALGAPPEEARRLLDGAELVVTSPSISPRFPTTDAWLREALLAAEARGAEVVSEVELFLRLTTSRVAAVTGTKGKTTTTALLGSILDAGEVPHVVGGNIGTPLIERVGELGAADWAILELSELQLPTISRGADLAVYTNIGADHLDRHGSIAAYRAVKARLARLSVERGSVVLNADDPGCVELGATLAGDLRWYGLDDRGLPATAEEGGAVWVAGRRLMSVAEVPLPGRHMLRNVLAAALAAAAIGVAPERIAAGIRGFRGVAHRLETLGEVAGVRYVNDSQATVPLAAIAGLEAFPAGRVVLIAGGQGKGLDYAALADLVARRARAAVLLGETAGELERLIAGRVPVARCASMGEAVRAAARTAHAGDVVLLSPAAASFDMFANYADRGDAFRRAVGELERPS